MEFTILRGDLMAELNSCFDIDDKELFLHNSIYNIT